jgi:hypothetical protein
MASGETVALRLEERTGERWRTVNLEVPEHPVVLVVGPSAAGSWGAFTAPVELGYGSWIAGKIAKNWLAFALAGSACLAGALALRSQSDIQRRDTFSLDDDGFVRLSSRSK